MEIKGTQEELGELSMFLLKSPDVSKLCQVLSYMASNVSDDTEWEIEIKKLIINIKKTTP